MPHPTHKLKAYCGEVNRPLVFCSECGLEEGEVSIHIPCIQSFYVPKLDTYIDKVQTQFVSGLPTN